MLHKNTAIRGFVVLLLALVTACSGQPRLGVLAQGETVSIQPPAGLDAGGEGIHNKAVGADAKTGAGTGALAGAAWGLSCGFYALICSPIGALAGAITGGMTGAFVGSTRGLSDDKVEKATSRLSSNVDADDPLQALHRTLINRAEKEWIIVPSDQTDHDVRFELRTLGLSSKGKQEVSLVVTLDMTVTYPDKAGKPRNREATFEYVGSPAPIDSWINDYNDFVAHRLADAYLTLSERIVEALLRRPG